jgi:RNA polymerase sigma factor (sigma-70 family)
MTIPDGSHRPMLPEPAALFLQPHGARKMWHGSEVVPWAILRFKRLESVGAMEQSLTAEPKAGELAELYQRHVGRATALARLLTADDQAAEDVAHEAFIRCVGRFAHLRRPDAFDAYLCRAVVNLCRTRSRRARIEREWLRRQDPREQIERPAFDPDDRDQIVRALERLPDRQRAAVALRYYEDLSLAQIGEILRCSDRAAEALVARALATLRQTIGEER